MIFLIATVEFEIESRAELLLCQWATANQLLRQTYQIIPELPQPLGSKSEYRSVISNDAPITFVPTNETMMGDLRLDRREVNESGKSSRFSDSLYSQGRLRKVYDIIPPANQDCRTGRNGFSAKTLIFDSHVNNWNGSFIRPFKPWACAHLRRSLSTPIAMVRARASSE